MKFTVERGCNKRRARVSEYCRNCRSGTIVAYIFTHCQHAGFETSIGYTRLRFARSEITVDNV